MKKILIIMNSLNCGGEENFVMNMYRHLNREKFEIAFLVPGISDEKQFFESEIEKKGDIIFKVSGKAKHPVKNFIEIYKIVKNHQFSVVHRHSDNSLMILDIWAARLGGAKINIAHSHNSNVSSNKLKFLHYVFRPFLKGNEMKRYACSEGAGRWMYGKSQFIIARNGIDSEMFRYKENIRQRKRADLEIKDEILLGHVGRFDEVKNQRFLVDIITKLENEHPGKYKLLFIGKGILEEKIKKYVREKHMENNVIFLGQQSNVYEWLQAIDIFVFPSIYEGLPVSLIEAQASGTKCIISDHISQEVAITPLVQFLTIEKGIELWCREIIEKSINLQKIDIRKMIIKSGYDIKNSVKCFEEIYSK